jgi:hypothetical protein
MNSMALFSVFFLHPLHLVRGFFMLSDRFDAILDALDASTQANILPRTLALELRLILFFIRVLNKAFLSPFGHLDAPACRAGVRGWRGEVLGDG